MQSLAQLLEYQGELLRAIEVAARKRDASAVLTSLKNLEMLGSLIRRQEEIDRTLVALKGGLAASPVTEVATTDSPNRDDDRKLSAKERGRRHRENFVRTLANMGVVLQPLKGVIFRSPRGILVGIASASESKKKDSWFLGLPEGRFEQAVLLCEEHSGNLRHFSLPKEFMSEHGEALSRKDGQIKFNVFRRNEFVLHLPRHGCVSIEDFRDNFSGLS